MAHNCGPPSGLRLGSLHSGVELDTQQLAAGTRHGSEPEIHMHLPMQFNKHAKFLLEAAAFLRLSNQLWLVPTCAWTQPIINMGARKLAICTTEVD